MHSVLRPPVRLRTRWVYEDPYRCLDQEVTGNDLVWLDQGSQETLIKVDDSIVVHGGQRAGAEGDAVFHLATTQIKCRSRKVVARCIVKIPERVKDRPEVEAVTRACALGNGPQYLSQLCEEGGVREAVNCVELGSRGRIAQGIR